MLTLEQVKALVEEGVGVFRVLPSYPVVKQDGVLRWGHADDRHLTDVDTKHFREADYDLISERRSTESSTHVGTMFYFTGAARTAFHAGTYVVKFERESEPNWATYVVLRFVDPDLEPGQATEMAIDYLLTQGWTEVEAQPLLVV